MHEHLIVLNEAQDSADEILTRNRLGAAVADGGMDEASLRDLLFRVPETLPISAIDAAYANPVPVCKELSTSAGRVDALYVNSAGRLILAEFKLWRNPQARREVIGQILDYAKEFASWGYEDLQREVSKTLGRKGNVLFEMIRDGQPETNEAEFVDNVTRHLRRGEFLLLIVGDGIREGVENIVDFVQRHSGLRFNLALVEAALYRGADSRLIVQPRILVRTEIVPRFVVEDRADGESLEELDKPPPELEQENFRFWSAVLIDYAFSDPVVEVPPKSKRSSIYVSLTNVASGGGGSAFCASLDRDTSEISCFLMRKKNLPATVRVFDELEVSLDQLADFEQWENRGSTRLGFRQSVEFPLVTDGVESDEFHRAVSWMRDRLDRLVSTVHPRLRAVVNASV